MSTHNGNQTNPINVAALRARLQREREQAQSRRGRRPGVPAPRHQAGPDRWFWWPATIALALVMGAVFLASAIGSVAAQREQDEQHLIRWCISCHGISSVEIQPEVDQ